MTAARLISRVYAMANDAPPIGAEAERRNAAARERLWREMGLVCIDPAQLVDDWLRAAIINEAVRQFGKRGAR